MPDLELTDSQIARNDDIDNAVYACICTLTEQEIDWDMEIIAEVTEAIKAALEPFNLKVRHPGIITNEDGSQTYEE